MKFTSKERVRAVLAGDVPDRVPVDYSANAAIHARLCRHFGLEPNDHEGLLTKLDTDFRGVGAPYRGPQRHPQPANPQVKVDEWGIHRRWVEHETGGYWDFCDFPLREATVEEVAAWPLPSPDDYDYSQIRAATERHRQRALFVGHAGVADCLNSTGMIRSYEQVLLDLALDEPAGLLYMDRRQEVQLEVLRRTLEAANGTVDFLWMGEDLGTQRGPLISLEMYRRHVRPRHQKVIDLAKSFDLPVMIHTCGSSSWAYPDLIEMGVNAVDTLQPEAADMSPEYLKKTFGGKLAFHGCISTAGELAYGSADEVERVCRETLEIMMPGGGYCLAPTHQLQDNTPVENVLRMYDCARKYGVY